MAFHIGGISVVYGGHAFQQIIVIKGNNKITELLTIYARKQSAPPSLPIFIFTHTSHSLSKHLISHPGMMVCPLIFRTFMKSIVRILYCNDSRETINCRYKRLTHFPFQN
jgi:hypothetical protein